MIKIGQYFKTSFSAITILNFQSINASKSRDCTKKWIQIFANEEQIFFKFRDFNFSQNFVNYVRHFL